MIVKCPVCGREKDSNYGKFICTYCKSRFEYKADGKIILIKRNKFDYSIFLTSLIFPLIFLFGFANIDFHFRDINILAGFFMLLYPLLILIRQIYYRFDTTILDLYYKFLKKDLVKEDIGRKIGFYLTFVTNIGGIVLILIKMIV